MGKHLSLDISRPMGNLYLVFAQSSLSLICELKMVTEGSKGIHF